MKVHVRYMSLLNFTCLAPPVSLFMPTVFENTDFFARLSHYSFTHYKNITFKTEYFSYDIKENYLNNLNFMAVVSFAPHILTSALLDCPIMQCFSTFVRLRPGKFFFFI